MVSSQSDKVAAFVKASQAAAADQKEEQKTLHQHLVKTKLCAYFSKGSCQWGDQCGFAHDTRELKSSPDLRKTRLCMAFQEGNCTRGERCNFAHGKHELAKADLFYKKTLCAWHGKGKCRNGDRCCFAHGAGELRRPNNYFKNNASKSTASTEHGEAVGDSDSTSADSLVEDGSSAAEASAPLTPTLAARSAPPRCHSPPGFPAPEVSVVDSGLPAWPRGPAPQGTLGAPPGVFVLPRAPAPRPQAAGPTAASLLMMPMKIHSSICAEDLL